MEYRSLGSTGMMVSAIGLGCEALGGTDWGRTDVSDASDAVRAAWDHGVTVFDTADVYGLGESERRLSQALGSARHEAVIVSKFGVRWQSVPSGRAETWRDSSPEYLCLALEESLRRLDVERIPVYLVHWPDDRKPFEDTLEALEAQRLAGKIGVYGVSNFWGAQLNAAAALGISVAELPLNLVDRRAEAELAECHRAGLAVIAYGAYAQGLLCGRYDRDSRFSRDDRRHRLLQFRLASWNTNEPLLRRIQSVADARGVTRAQVALRWVLGHADLSCVLVGARHAGQLADTLAAGRWELTADETAFLVDEDDLLRHSELPGGT